MKKNFYVSMALVMLTVSSSPAAPVTMTSSNLPIVIIDTGGQSIPDEPKITADMKIVYDREGGRNEVSGPFDEYDGKIGIEIRGATSQYIFPKKQYAIETRDENGEDLDVPVMGMPAESDWVLYAPYSDKSLMRNILTYKLSNDMGQYASRTRFCELILNGEYMGIYVWMEKIKRDKNRVNIAKLEADEISGDDLTGGYIVKIDKRVGEETEGWYSVYPSSGTTTYYQYHYPDQDDIAPEQKTYIQNFVNEFETLMKQADYADPETGYNCLIDRNSFIDYLIINEVTRNVDGYRLSTFMYKDKDSDDGRLKMGPVWDFNIALGNANYYDGWLTEGWQVDFSCTKCITDYNQIPFWWQRLLEDPNFQLIIRYRWRELRKNILHTETILAFIDSVIEMVDESQARNFTRWPVLGVYVWPNPDGWQSRRTYVSETDYLKHWLTARLQWLDQQWEIEHLPGDLDGFDGLTLRDAVLGLQICSGIPTEAKVYTEADINSDGLLGLEEAGYILRQIAASTAK